MANDESNFITSFSQFLDNSGEHLTYAALSTYRNFSEELSLKEKLFFKNHLDRCADCEARLREISEVEGAIGEVTPNIIGSISPIVIRYAVAATVVIAVGTGLFFFSQDIQQKSVASDEVHTDRQIASATTDPEKFIPNQILENFIDRTVRSTEKISLVTPAVGETLSTPYKFRWQGPKQQYTLTIVDNNNTEVWKKTIASSEIMLSDKLKIGLYYLKIEVNENLTSVSKFVVVR